MDTALTATPIAPEHADYVRALAMALNLSTAKRVDAPTQAAVESFLEGCQACGVDTDVVVAGYRAGRLAGAAVVAAAPEAKAGVVFVSPTHDDASCDCAIHIMDTIVHASGQREIRLLQHLCEPNDEQRAYILSESGFRYLTRLIYLRRDRGLAASVLSAAGEIDWITYSPKVKTRFCAALEQTYAKSMDCPELTGLRKTDEVMASHRSTGLFDPSLWSLALQNGEPVGVLLLSRIAPSRALEVVYIGVVDGARGRGIGDALMARAIAAVEADQASCLTLAVDHRNMAARSLYARWGMQEKAARDAWITTSSGPPTW